MTEKKRRKPMGKRADHDIKFRCTEHQRWIIEQAAHREGLSLSAYVRQACLARVRASSAQDAAPEMLALFREAIKDK